MGLAHEPGERDQRRYGAGEHRCDAWLEFGDVLVKSRRVYPMPVNPTKAPLRVRLVGFEDTRWFKWLRAAWRKATRT